MKKESMALVRAAAKGDKEAFVALIDDCRQTMYATAMTVTRNEDDALDAISDTILAMWEKISQLKDPGAFRTWAIRILVNRCRDTLRSRKREAVGEYAKERGKEPDWDIALDVNRAMDLLAEEDRLVLQLFYFEDMRVKDIARALDITSEAARMRLSRGRKRFKEQYERKEPRYEKQ